MKHLTILVPNAQTGSNTLSCIIGALQVFTEANNYYQQQGLKPVLQVQLAGTAGRADFVNGLLTVAPQTDIGAIQHTDLIIIPALNAGFKQVEADNIPLVEWIQQQYKGGAEVASMCTGAYLLAATGLLNKRTCSIHWDADANFRQLYPQVHLKTEKLITDEQGIYTNGGGYSFLNLLIYLVEKYYNRQTAIFCSKVFQIDIDRQTQSDFVIFSGQKAHGDEAIKEAQEYMEKNFSEKISVEELSRNFAIGRRNFDRRFIKATNNTPVEYLQRVKVEFAKKAFETTPKTINEVMYEAGYSDTKAFREVFRKITGISPLEYKNKYGKYVRAGE